MLETYRNNGTINRTVIYLKSHHRRPVRARAPLGLVDLQDIPPPDWCHRCGRELYESNCPCGSNEKER